MEEEKLSIEEEKLSMEEGKLSTDEVLSILAKRMQRSDFELINYDLKVLEEKVGMLGDHYILAATVKLRNDPKETLKLSFFVKFLPFSSETQHKFCVATGAFKKELFVYELFAKIKEETKTLDCVPNCYFHVDDKVLVFDNLSEGNYKLADKMKTLDYEHVLCVLNSLAKLHASSVIYEERRGERLNKKFRLIDGHERDFEETFYNDRADFINHGGVDASLKAILSEIDIFGLQTLRSGKRFKDVLGSIYYKIYDLVKRDDSERNVICHGDLWATNYVLKHVGDAPVDCKFVDFQQARYLHPAHDLMCFLHLNTTRKFRGEHLYELIGRYYATLEKILKLSNVDINVIWGFDDFLKCCERLKLFALLQTATYFQFVLADSEFLREFMDDSEKSWEVLHKDRTYLVVRNLEMNETYAERLKESVLDLKEYCDYL